MSKKRNSNARKKQVAAKRKTQSKRSGSAPAAAARKPQEALSVDLEAEWEDPDVETPVKSGGGAFTAMRSGMSRRETGEDAGVFHKQRSLAEWALWFGAAGVATWLAIRFLT